MKCIMVTPRYKKDIRGGGEISCALLVEALRKQGIEVDVLAGDELFPSIKDTWKLNIKMYRAAKKLINTYDVWHFYNMSLLPMAGLLTKKYNINSVASLNGHNFSPTFAAELSDHPAREHLINSVLLNTTFKHIKRFTALSEFYKEAWAKDGIPQEKIRVIPNMIDENYVAKNLIHSKTTRILSVGNYAKWRNLKLLLGSYSNLPKQDIVLEVVGQGWRREVIDYKGKNTVIYYPKVEHDNLKRMYSMADIYVQPYNYFGIGRSMLEAAQNRTALVTTGRLQDFPYLFGHINYFANKDTLQLTLQTLIKNKDLCRDQGRYVCDVVNKYLNPKIISKQHIKLYEEVIE